MIDRAIDLHETIQPPSWSVMVKRLDELPDVDTKGVDARVGLRHGDVGSAIVVNGGDDRQPG